MVRIKEKRIEQGLTQPELAKSINKDVPLISKFENFVCLPVPEDATKIAKTLKCTTILELYDEEDLKFLEKATTPKKKRDAVELLVYRLTADLPRNATDWLTKENLQLLQYSSIREWVNDCFNKFKKRVKKKRAISTAIKMTQENSVLTKTIHK